MGGFSVDLHLNFSIGEGGYISFQECDGGFTIHGCGMLYCELDVQVDCIKMAMEIVKLHCQHVDAPCEHHPFGWMIDYSYSVSLL